MAHFEIKDLTFYYPGRENPALEHVNLSVAKGEYITICGKSGCGNDRGNHPARPCAADRWLAGKDYGGVPRRH